MFPVADTEPTVGMIVSVPAEKIAQAIGICLAAGMAVMFSPVSAGTAVGVHLWHGNIKDKRYATSQAAFLMLLEAVCDVAEAKLAGDLTAPAKRPGNGL